MSLLIFYTRDDTTQGTKREEGAVRRPVKKECLPGFRIPYLTVSTISLVERGNQLSIWSIRPSSRSIVVLRRRAPLIVLLSLPLTTRCVWTVRAIYSGCRVSCCPPLKRRGLRGSSVPIDKGDTLQHRQEVEGVLAAMPAPLLAQVWSLMPVLGR